MTERPNRTFAGCRVWMALAVLALLHDSATCTTDQKKHRGSSAVNATHVRACAVYNTDSQCNECYAGYQLTDGRCKRLTSSQKTTTGKSGLCHQKCGRSYITQANGQICHCDYFCNNHGDCCGGSASKDAACPHMAPTRNKADLSNGLGILNKQTRSTSAERVGSSLYLPGMCWCDQYCRAAGDCCPQCSSSNNTSSSSSGGEAGGNVPQAAPAAAAARVGISSVSVAAADISSISNAATATQADLQMPDNHTADVAAVVADSSSPLAQQIAAKAAAAAAKSGNRVDDCGAESLHISLHQPSPSSNGSSVGIAQVDNHYALVQAEAMMQECQAKDTGPPAKPYVIPVHWTAGQVCRNGVCTGGRYSPATVRKQITHLNDAYARVGIQFSWDNIIHKATAADVLDISICSDPKGQCWVCKQQRYGDRVAMNVVTSPTHVGGSALGVTIYPAYIYTGKVPECASWVFIYEKTLPGLGGRSLVDGGLADGGGTLAHEVGHALMLRHTWYEGYVDPNPPVTAQCQASASTDPSDIYAGNSDGVRDTPAQSRNGSASAEQKTDILRFVQCDKRTGAYRNRTANAQQSCTSAVGFPNGDNYYNNYGNLMSYGDKTCLRTLTPGQGARARCGLKCIRQGKC